MGIYIPGMEMPKNCGECKLFGEYGCPFVGPVGYAVTEGRRNEDCPLIPVPTHGRLIDADALTKMCQEMQSIEWNSKASPYSWAYAYESFEGDIDNAPTVIPAEEGET